LSLPAWLGEGEAAEEWTSPPETYLVIMELHDFLAFASREISGVAVTAPFINNTALNYAINRGGVHRVASDQRPHYMEDFASIRMYATPARLLGIRSRGRLVDVEPVRITYNAVNTVLQVTEEYWSVSGKVKQRKVALPRLGAYLTYPPGTLFAFFCLGGRPPRVVRVGKKGAQATLKVYEAEKVKVAQGPHSPDHPLNPMDLPKGCKILQASLEPVPPAGLLTSARVTSPHLRAIFQDPITGKEREFKITLPSRGIYRSLGA